MRQIEGMYKEYWMPRLSQHILWYKENKNGLGRSTLYSQEETQNRLNDTLKALDGLDKISDIIISKYLAEEKEEENQEKNKEEEKEWIEHTKTYRLHAEKTKLTSEKKDQSPGQANAEKILGMTYKDIKENDKEKRKEIEETNKWLRERQKETRLIHQTLETYLMKLRKHLTPKQPTQEANKDGLEVLNKNYKRWKKHMKYLEKQKQGK